MEHTPTAQRAFFGRRKGHALKPRQAALFDTLLPRLALDLGKPPPVDPRALFDKPPDDVRLEIGFGGAEHLIAQAQSTSRAAASSARSRSSTASPRRLRRSTNTSSPICGCISATPARCIDWLPAGALARIDLLYPDPWPKRRHWKRRFIQDDSLKRLARILRPGGELRFATDIADYAACTLARVLRSPDFIWTAERADDWRQPWPGFAGTRYEAKAKREGRTAAYFIFRKL